MAPLTGDMLYVLVVPGQTFVFPPAADMLPGKAGAVPETLTVRVRVLLIPQLLFAITEMVPPAVPAVTLMLFVADEPDHPEGNVQV